MKTRKINLNDSQVILLGELLENYVGMVTMAIKVKQKDKDLLTILNAVQRDNLALLKKLKAKTPEIKSDPIIGRTPKSNLIKPPSFNSDIEALYKASLF